MDITAFSSSVAFLIPVIIIGIYTLYLLVSKNSSSFADVRKSLIVAFVFGLTRLSLPVIKLFPNVVLVAPIYIFLLGITELCFIIFLALSALGIYLQSSKESSSVHGMVRTLLSKSRAHSAIFFGFCAYSIFFVSFVMIGREYVVVSETDIFGGIAQSPIVNPSFAPLLIPAVIMIVFYVPALFILASRKVSELQLSRSFLYLAIASFACGISFPILTYFQDASRIETGSAFHLIQAVIFSLTAISFNRASTFASFLDYRSSFVQGGSMTSIHPFTSDIQKDAHYVFDKQFLMEVDVAVHHESFVSDFVFELMSSGVSVFVVTSKFSAIYRALSSFKDIHFYILTDRVSYAKSVENQVLIPQDLGVLRDTIEQIQSASKGSAKAALIVDSVTDLIITMGFEGTYKFMKDVLAESVDTPMTELYIIHRQTLDDKVVNPIRSLFINLLGVSKDRLVVIKEQQIA